MSIQSNKINHILQGKNWLTAGWKLFKKKPLTWVFMVLIFSIFYLVGMNSVVGQYIVALIAPVLAGGIFLAADKSNKGEAISIEDLFSMLKKPQKLKQLLVIGAIGLVVVTLIYLVQNMPGSDYVMRYQTGSDRTYSDDRTTTLGNFLSTIFSWAWSFSVLFSIPLVAIKDEKAVDSLKSSFSAFFNNFMPLIIFFFFSILLIFIGMIPFGLGLLVVIPILFCSFYYAFNSVYLEDAKSI